MTVSIEQIALQLAVGIGVDVEVNADDSVTIAGTLTIHRKGLDCYTVDGLTALLMPWFKGWQDTCTAAGMSAEEAKKWTKHHLAAIVAHSRSKK